MLRNNVKRSLAYIYAYVTEYTTVLVLCDHCDMINTDEKYYCGCVNAFFTAAIVETLILKKQEEFITDSYSKLQIYVPGVK